MKLKDLLEKYGEYEVSETKGDWCDAGHITLEINKPKPKTVGDLEKGVDTYYYVDETGDVGISTWYDWECDRGRFNIGIAFLTEKEAEKDVERRKVETLLLKFGGRRWFDGHSHNYRVALDDYEEHLKVYILMTPTQGTIYFDTKEQAEKAVKKIGAERIKEALFEVR